MIYSDMEKKLIAKRGDHAGGWYLTDPIKKRCVKLYHSDWCLFDEEGNLAIDKDGRPYCWTTKGAAQWNAENNTDWIAGYAKPIECPIKFTGLAV